MLGVAELCNKLTGPHFSDFDEEAARAFAIYCGIALVNSFMYHKVMDTQERVQLSNELMMYHMQVGAGMGWGDGDDEGRGDRDGLCELATSGQYLADGITSHSMIGAQLPRAPWIFSDLDHVADRDQRGLKLRCKLDPNAASSYSL